MLIVNLNNVIRDKYILLIAKYIILRLIAIHVPDILILKFKVEYVRLLLL